MKRYYWETSDCGLIHTLYDNGREVATLAQDCVEDVTPGRDLCPITDELNRVDSELAAAKERIKELVGERDRLRTAFDDRNLTLAEKVDEASTLRATVERYREALEKVERTAQEMTLEVDEYSQFNTWKSLCDDVDAALEG